uniref:Laccase-like multicopper oxidase 3 n=1 Tax=Nannophya pygmaea TaxID=229391 RepID=A0A2Z5WPZ7_NANPY|nr:laccase-like multicopper oxidase 3 [Nannophya pygmaea]
MTTAILLLAVSLAIAASAAHKSDRISRQLKNDPRVLQLLYSDYETERTNSWRRAKQIPVAEIKVGGCHRPCRLGAPPRICHYKFTLENYVTMGEACGDCPRNRTDCFEPNCVTADGYEKSVLTVNRMIPGPTIDVCRGDIVVVDVHNMMHDRATSIHWHGVIMKETPHSDGVAELTQCAIPPGVTFRYVFKAFLGGTHFWHSHEGLQKMDGIEGKLVVRVPPEEDVNLAEYDLDLREHTLIITDWIHDLTDARLPGVGHRLIASSQHRPDNFLLNGLGRYVDPVTGISNETPLWVANVFVGQRHKFRLINGGCTVCPTKLTIEGHRMRILAADLHPVVPVTVDTLLILPGERYDIVLIGPPNVSAGDVFWIHVTVDDPCNSLPGPPQQVGILNYVSSFSSFSSNDAREPSTVIPRRGFEAPNGITFNSLDGKCNAGSRQLCASYLQFNLPQIGPPAPSFTATFPGEIFRLVAAFGFHFPKKEDFHRPDTFEKFFYPGIAVQSVINNYSMVMPPSPPLSQFDDLSPNMFCPNPIPGVLDKPNEFKECFNLVRVPLNALVEILIHSEGQPVPMSHPFHLHGYDFQVLRQGTFNSSSPTAIRNLRDSFYTGILQSTPDSSVPSLRDTIAIPSLGYAVIRFRAFNPGFWLMHCHFAFHLATGMSIVFQVGEPSDMVPAPPGFPRCGDYLPSLI